MSKKFKRGMLVKFTDNGNVERLCQASYFTVKFGLKRQKMFYYSTSKRMGWGPVSDPRWKTEMIILGFDKDQPLIKRKN